MQRNNLKIFFLVPFFFACNIFISLIQFKPYYGPMDDGRYLKLAKSVHDFSDFFSIVYKIGILQDFNDGFIRFTHLTLVLPFYLFGNPETLYILNAIFVLLIAYLLVKELTIILCDEFRVDFFVLSTIFLLIWPWTFDLFIYPSLQEKSVLFLLFINLRFIRYQLEKSNPRLWDFIFSFILVVLAFGTKIHFVAFVPGLIALINQSFSSTKMKVYKIFYIFLYLILSIILLWIAFQGNYTSKISSNSLISNLINSLYNVWILVALLIILCSLFTINLYKSIIGSKVVLLFGLFTCIGIMFWGSYSYILSILGIFLSCLFINLVTTLFRKFNFVFFRPLIFKWSFIFISIAICFLWINYRSYTAFTNLRSIYVFFDSSFFSNIPNNSVFLPCKEASEHYNFYSYVLTKKLPFSSTESTSSYIFTNRRLCPYETNGHLLWPKNNSSESWNLFQVS